MPIRHTQRTYNGYAHPNIPGDFRGITEYESGVYTPYGHPGGMYGNWINDLPTSQRDRIVAAIEMIEPLDADGNPNEYPIGFIGYAHVGMSHMMMESSMFYILFRNDSLLRDDVRGAVFAESGVEISLMSDPNHWFWTDDGSIKGSLASREAQFQQTRRQTQVIFLKQAVSQTGKFIVPFPDNMAETESGYRAVIENCHLYFPNLKLMFLVGRSYSAYDQKGLNPDLRTAGGQISWGTNWVVQKILADDIAGNNPSHWVPLVGCPDMWNNGNIPNVNTDMVMYREDYSEKDGIHPARSMEGLAGKVANNVFWQVMLEDVWSRIFIKPQVTASSALTWRDGSNANTYITSAWTPSTNSAHVFFVRTFDNALAESPTSITGNNMTWIKHSEITSADGQENLSVWYATGTQEATTGQLTITFANPMLNCTVNGVALSGANEFEPIVSVTAGEQTGIADNSSFSVTRTDWQQHGLNYMLHTVSCDSAEFLRIDTTVSDVYGWMEIINQNPISPSGTLVTWGVSELTKTVAVENVALA